METIENGSEGVEAEIAESPVPANDKQGTMIGIPRRIERDMKSDSKWKTEKRITVGSVSIEISRYENTDRLSMRMAFETKSWVPIKETTFDEVHEAILGAMQFVDEEHTRREASLLARAQKEADKRKRHSENFERRREENRQRTNGSKGKRG